HNVGQLINKSTDYEKTMWERIEMELEQMSESFCDVFKEPCQKYRLNQNDTIMDICKEFIHNEKMKINVDDELSNVKYGRWLDNSEKLQT
ncbi:9850_t:CDS:2, partial [Funneliformis geosporum]